MMHESRTGGRCDCEGCRQIRTYLTTLCTDGAQRPSDSPWMLRPALLLFGRVWSTLRRASSRSIFDDTKPEAEVYCWLPGESGCAEVQPGRPEEAGAGPGPARNYGVNHPKGSVHPRSQRPSRENAVRKTLPQGRPSRRQSGLPISIQVLRPVRRTLHSSLGYGPACWIPMAPSAPGTVCSARRAPGMDRIRDRVRRARGDHLLACVARVREGIRRSCMVRPRGAFCKQP